ncbi:hypothetical protein C8T65DRAFT_591468 [Cerioporus squamosus]|nr:hypothetical protein C8T65DRAFT_591468 [Cerioporus squamosus]
MADDCLKHREAIDRLCGDIANNLREYELTPAEWEIVRQLREVLKVPFSHAGTPNLAMVILAMDHIGQVLTTVSLSHHQYDNTVRVACQLAKALLNKYYSLTDISNTYRIALILHPRHKLTYFKKLRWTEAWQRTTRKMIIEEYKSNYAGRVSGDGVAEEEDVQSSAGDVEMLDKVRRTVLTSDSPLTCHHRVM